MPSAARSACSGWIPTPNGKKFQYITKTHVDGMLPKLILKWNPKKANEVLVIVNGKSGDFADPSVTLPLKATVSRDPTDAMTSLCAQAEFPGPKPLLYCRMSGNGVAVTCKWEETMKRILLAGIPTFRLRTAPGSALQ